MLERKPYEMQAHRAVVACVICYYYIAVGQGSGKRQAKAPHFHTCQQVACITDITVFWRGVCVYLNFTFRLERGVNCQGHTCANALAAKPINPREDNTSVEQYRRLSGLIGNPYILCVGPCLRIIFA